jgi:hypothetical protein
MKKLIAIIPIFLMLLQSANSQIIAKDKQLHIGYGTIVSAWSYTIPDEAKGLKPIIYGISGAAIIGVGKESYDYLSYGKFDYRDLGATILGGVISVSIITGVKAIIKGHKINKVAHHQNKKRKLFVLK